MKGAPRSRREGSETAQPVGILGTHFTFERGVWYAGRGDWQLEAAERRRGACPFFFGQMQDARQRVVGANRVMKDVSPFQGSFRVNGSNPGLREYAYPGLKNAAPLGLRNRVSVFPGGLAMWRSAAPLSSSGVRTRCREAAIATSEGACATGALLLNGAGFLGCAEK